MFKTSILSITVIALISFGVQASCESVTDEISQKIIQNGVPQYAFALKVLANDQPDPKGSLIVGHCQNKQQKIVYQRIENAGPDQNGAADDVITP